ncbi:hypothetical protein HELRODRAFT_88660, partial [Helobdella robusta]|uniref:DUS-like FMN-binding domain-containing protein n=1 Tax=Helobdella robusta TaxID=6412 RepID=T1G751_HELRO
IMNNVNKCRHFYENKVILAPMVRISCLPMRLLALEYGADLVFCEEIIDHKMLQCRQVQNELLGTTDFLWSDDSVIFRTCDLERDKVIFQIGTSSADRALKVAKMVEDHVAGIDINMGCPKEFSIKGGMGAALMSQPEKFSEILTSLVKNVKKPISCKTRIKSDLEGTLEMMKRIEATGVSCITIHGRTKEERPNDENHDDVISHVTCHLTVPVVANGGSSMIKTYKDIEVFKKSTNCSSVMIGRSAMWNPSIFRNQGCTDDVDVVIRKFLKYAIKYDTFLACVKYCIQQFMHENLESYKGRQMLNSTTVREIW